MTEGATTRESRRLATERRIVARAQELTLERGLDGFTMDDLAAAAEVSRRTLFNYFPSKLDAVLGGVPERPAAELEAFLAGGPSGVLVDDLAVLAAALLSTKGLTRAELERGQRVVLTNPRLIGAAHERFELLIGEYVDVILAREGAAFGRERAALLVRLLVSVFDACLPDPSGPASDGDQPDRPIDELFVANLRTARYLLA